MSAKLFYESEHHLTSGRSIYIFGLLCRTHLGSCDASRVPMVMGHRNQHGDNTGDAVNCEISPLTPSWEFTREHTNTAETSRLVRRRRRGDMITEPRGDSDNLCLKLIKRSFFLKKNSPLVGTVSWPRTTTEYSGVFRCFQVFEHISKTGCLHLCDHGETLVLLAPGHH